MFSNVVICNEFRTVDGNKMQDLRLILIVIGAITIIALLLHGLWTSCKERCAVFRNRSMKQFKQERQERNETSLSKLDKRIGRVCITSIRHDAVSNLVSIGGNSPFSHLSIHHTCTKQAEHNSSSFLLDDRSKQLALDTVGQPHSKMPPLNTPQIKKKRRCWCCMPPLVKVQ